MPKIEINNLEDVELVKNLFLRLPEISDLEQIHWIDKLTDKITNNEIHTEFCSFVSFIKNPIIFSELIKKMYDLSPDNKIRLKHCIELRNTSYPEAPVCNSKEDIMHIIRIVFENLTQNNSQER